MYHSEYDANKKGFTCAKPMAQYNWQIKAAKRAKRQRIVKRIKYTVVGTGLLLLITGVDSIVDNALRAFGL